MTRPQGTSTDQAFKAYMRAIDRRLAGLLGGLTSSDLADWNYRDAFDGEMPIAEAVEEVLEWNDIDLEDLT